MPLTLSISFNHASVFFAMRYIDGLSGKWEKEVQRLYVKEAGHATLHPHIAMQ